MIVIISDIHDNVPNLKTALTQANSIKANALFVLGDITTADTLKFMADNFTQRIYLTTGNAETGDLPEESKKYSQLKFLGRQGGVITIGRYRVGLCHEPALARNLKPAGLIFYGHTHKPWEEVKNGVRLVNPGNLANIFYPPSFAVWDEDNDRLELRRL